MASPKNLSGSAAVQAAERFNPWLFVPLLYFMQAMPVTIVQDVAQLVYKDMGVNNALITQWTSLIAIPWSMQFLLGPLVELNHTNRRWILGGQLLITLGLIVSAFAMQLPNAFTISLAILAVTAVTSALCNIATDGFYILALHDEQQGKFVGVQTTCYRLGRLFCVGLLVKLVGVMQQNKIETMLAWSYILGAAAVIYGVGYLWNLRAVPRPVADVARPETEPNQNRNNLWRTLLIVVSGLGTFFFLSAVWRMGLHHAFVNFGTLAGQDLKGWRLEPDVAKTFIGPFALGVDGYDAERIQLGICFVILLGAIPAMIKLLRGTEMAKSFGTFLAQDKILAILSFVLFYRLGEAMVSKMSGLFYKDKMIAGGLGLDNSVVGDIKGFIGVIGIILGGLIGGWVVSKIGLRKAFWPLALFMHLPNLLYLIASSNPAGALVPKFEYVTHFIFENKFVIYPKLWGIEFVDQFGYGFGFAAYYVFLMQVAGRGNYKTAHFAIGSGLGAMCIVLAGILGGIIQTNYGYHAFFISVIFCTIPGMLTLLFIPLKDDSSVKPIAAV